MNKDMNTTLGRTAWPWNMLAEQRAKNDVFIIYFGLWLADFTRCW
jgi:hypothetical protein